MELFVFSMLQFWLRFYGKKRSVPAAVMVLFAALLLVVSVAPVVSDPVVKNSFVLKRRAAVKNAAAQPLGMREIGPEAIAPLGCKESAAVTIAADAFFRYERIISEAAIKTGIS